MSTRVVVHNIEHKATDEEIISFMELVGPLKCQTDNPKIKMAKINREKDIKVYGNFEYVDQQSALSAYRNLNKREFKGRELQVKYNEMLDKNQNNQRQTNLNGQTTILLQSQNQHDRQKIFDEKIDKVSNMQELLELLPRNEKIFLMNEMKNLLKDNPSFVGAYLQQNPQFTQMILDLQTELNLNPHNTVHTKTDMSQIQAPNIVQNQLLQNTKDKFLNQPPPLLPFIPQIQNQQQPYNQQQQMSQIPQQQNIQQKNQNQYGMQQQQQIGGFAYSKPAQQPINQQQPFIQYNQQPPPPPQNQNNMYQNMGNNKIPNNNYNNKYQ